MRTGFFKKEWIFLAVILLVTFAVFSPALKNDFVNWDDGENISDNPNVTELNAAGIKGMFSTSITGGYTPLTTLSFATEIHFFGMKPAVFHFNNILLHVLCTLLVFIFLRSLGMSLFISLAAALLFGIHPMRVESVAWISERKDVLYSLFFLLSMISYIKYYSGKKVVFYFLALLAFVFALLTKIQAVSLPLILLLIDYYLDGKFRFKQIPDKIPFFLLSLATGIAGILILSHDGELDAGSTFPLIQRVFIGTFSLCMYVVKSVVPFQLSAIYPYPEKLTILHYASPLVVLLLAFLIYKSGKYRKELVFGSLFFLFNVVFVLQIVGAGQALMADRFTYLGYIGLFFIMAWAVNFLFTGQRKPYVVIAGILYLGALGVLTWNRTQVWKNSGTLFADVISKYPQSSIAHNNLGLYYRDQNQNESAIQSFNRAIAINPAGYLSYSNRGEAYFNDGEIDKALADMNRAIQLKPDYTSALSNRGAIHGARKEFSLALTDLDKAISLDSRNLKAYTNRALVYYSTGDFEKASRDITTYLSIKPDNPDLHNLRGLCFGRLNKFQEAMSDFSRAILLKPNMGAYYQNRSSLLYRMGDKNGALRDIRKAQELGAKVNPDFLKGLDVK